LSVYATERGAFDGRAEDVLAEFAGTIGTAVDRAEAKQTLAGGRVTVLRLEVTAPDRPLTRMARALDDTVCVRSATPVDSGAQLCVETATQADPAVLERVAGVERVERIGENTYAVRVTEATLPTRVAAHGGATTATTAT
ncbi:MAG: bacterio-opsin activator domain-containing protein, partial [Halobaculum sp.]